MLSCADRNGADGIGQGYTSKSVLALAPGLGVELDGEPGPRAVDDAFVGAIVGIHHQGHPACWQGLGVHREAVVLRGDVAALRAEVHNRLVHATVAELHLEGACPCRQGQDLVSQADAEDLRVMKAP